MRGAILAGALMHSIALCNAISVSLSTSYFGLIFPTLNSAFDNNLQNLLSKILLWCRVSQFATVGDPNSRTRHADYRLQYPAGVWVPVPRL